MVRNTFMEIKKIKILEIQVGKLKKYCLIIPLEVSDDDKGLFSRFFKSVSLLLTRFFLGEVKLAQLTNLFNSQKDAIDNFVDNLSISMDDLGNLEHVKFLCDITDSVSSSKPIYEDVDLELSIDKSIVQSSGFTISKPQKIDFIRNVIKRNLYEKITAQP